MSLVPDYGSSSSEPESNDCEGSSNLLLYEENERNSDSGLIATQNFTIPDQMKPSTSVAPLPSASKLLSGISSVGDVFHNPYKLAENEKIASLEKHVKMVATDEHTYVKNGKKMCWNFRKGRCRFGSNCTYAHDSDIHESANGDELSLNPPPSAKDHSTSATTTVVKGKRYEQKRKHPGLGNSIVPSKKVMKQYNINKVLK